MAGFEGMEQLIVNVKKLPAHLEREAKQLVQDTAQGVVRDAVNNLRANGTGDTGGLMQSVTALPKKNGLSMEVFVGKNYAHAIEFGTKNQVDFSDQPAELRIALQQYALQFKGTPTGTWDEFLLSIQAWVKRKGITGVYSVKTRKRLTGKKYNNDQEDKQVAFLIARSIYRHGIPARPFFFPAWQKNAGNFTKEMNKVLRDTLLKRIGGWFKDLL